MFFFRLFSSKRPECASLRKQLLNKYHPNCHCSLCMNAFPKELLDMAHLKPRHSITCSIERRNINNVEFMCKLCHAMYDRGFIGINHYGRIENSPLISHNKIGQTYSKYNENNAAFLNWHYFNIFLKSK
jgi:predicted restriction endonuclease